MQLGYPRADCQAPSGPRVSDSPDYHSAQWCSFCMLDPYEQPVPSWFGYTSPGAVHLYSRICARSLQAHDRRSGPSGYRRRCSYPCCYLFAGLPARHESHDRLFDLHYLVHDPQEVGYFLPIRLGYLLIAWPVKILGTFKFMLSSVGLDHLNTTNTLAKCFTNLVNLKV